MSRIRVKPRVQVTDLAATVAAWTPTQRSAARLRAIGYTQKMVAQELNAGERTVQEWCELPGFDQYVAELHAAAWQRVEPALLANLELAIDVQRRCLIGEIKHNDGRYIEARRLIDRLLDASNHSFSTPRPEPADPPPPQLRVVDVTPHSG